MQNGLIGKRITSQALGLAGLTILGLILRFFRLPTVPIGAHGDIAWKGLNALDWLQYGIWPYYIYELYAPEPVNVYLLTLMYAVTGQVSFFVSRIPTAVTSALVIPVGFLALRWLNPDADDRNDKIYQRAMWLFALAYAVSFYPIMLSKTGQRAQHFPFLVILLTLFFAHAWQTGKWRSFVATAVVMAIANYTYIPARLLPIMVGLWAAYGWLVDRRTFYSRWRQLAAMYCIAALLVLPQIITYIQTPEAFFARSDQQAGRLIFQSGLSVVQIIGTLLTKVAGEFAIFVLPWRSLYSAMGRPLLGIPLTAGFVLATWAACHALRGQHIRQSDRADLSMWWPLIGIPVMFTTDVLSGTQWQPHGLRMIGILPFVFILATRGLALLWGWLETHWEQIPSSVWVAGVTTLILLPGLINLSLYHFGHIPAVLDDPATANATESADQYIVELIHRHQEDRLPVLITLDDFLRANIPFLLANSYPVRRSGIDADGEILTVVQTQEEVLVIIPADPYRPRHDGRIPEHDGRSWVMLVDGEMLMLPELCPSGAVNDVISPIDTVEDGSGQTIASLARIPFDPSCLAQTTGQVRDRPYSVPQNADLGGEIALRGYSVDSYTLKPGVTFWITLYWQASAQGVSEDYETFVQIWDREGRAISQVHRWTLDGVYRTRIWQPDEWVPTRFQMTIPVDAVPGPYTIITGMYSVLRNEPLYSVDAAGQAIAPHASIPGFRIALDATPLDLPYPASSYRFLDRDSSAAIEVTGIDIEQEEETLVLMVNWRAQGFIRDEHTLFIHIVDDQERIVAQLDTQPRGGAYPTQAWIDGEIVPDEYRIATGDLLAGAYKVYIGWYTLPIGNRLGALMDGQPVPDARIEIYRLIKE